ncbi:hypothetical protein CspHIS471_0105180 [Cutaneotrichosporon sp. HIS471]|nr:hypothetical protein CspHIS471_0105180 [Cutaneotrichosporon sp. HIS471]
MLVSVAILAAAAVTLAPANLRALAMPPIGPDKVPNSYPFKSYPAPFLPEGESCNTKRSSCARDNCYDCCDDGKHACPAPGFWCHKNIQGVYMCLNRKGPVDRIPKPPID